jgi:hypothetical protein
MPAGMSFTTGCEKTDLQVQLLALGLGPEAHADQVQLLLEALADAAHHVGHQRAHGAAHGVGFGGVVGRREGQRAPSFLTVTSGDSGTRQRAVATLDGDLFGRDRHVHTLRDGDRHLSYAGHVRFLPLGHVAEDFAADAGLARLAVGHHALGRGDDGHAQAVHDLRNGVAALVDAQAGAADTLDALDDRAPGVVLQRDLELGSCRRRR